MTKKDDRKTEDKIKNKKQQKKKKSQTQAKVKILNRIHSPLDLD